MSHKQIALSVVCGVLLVLTGCSRPEPTPPGPQPAAPVVRSVYVSPDLHMYSPAHPGDILEFKALDPNTADFYVVFDGPSPCENKPPNLLVKKGTAARCKVSGDLDFYKYHFSRHPNDEPLTLPETCPQCWIINEPESGIPSLAIANPSSEGNQGASVPAANAPTPAPQMSTLTSTPPLAYQVAGVKCDAEKAKVRALGATPGGIIQWGSVSGGQVTITMPQGSHLCKDENGKDRPVLKQFESCIVSGSVQPDPYTYTVQTSACQASGSGSLTIVAPKAGVRKR